MITESYVDDSIRAGIVRNGLLKYMRWGEDLDYVDKFKTTRDEVFTFITTGKAYRDYDTVCAAFEKVNSARLKVFTANGWGGYDYKAILDKYRNPNIEVYYTNGMSGNVMDYLYSEMQKSHCALVICQKVKFGVGYTQVLDSMACSLPVIATFNPGNPIDIDKEGVGCTVPACDLEALAKAMQRMVDDAEWHNSCSKAARKLVEKDYNLRNMSLSEISNLPDVSEGLENTIKKAANSCNNIADFINIATSKRYTETRLKRILLYSLLKISKRDIAISKKVTPYIRVLGFNETGKKLLSNISKSNPRLNIITSVKRFEETNINKNLKILLEKDILATNIYTLGYMNDSWSNLDYTKKIIK